LTGISRKPGIVTGAASGIGFAIARLLAERGGCVAMLDINSEELEKATELIKNKGGSVILTGSLAGLKGWKRSAYTAAKGGAYP
jgi:NAD(P)-dependent dehydrogenase (short-subunit alcohol dehydrogenase family)